MTDSTDPRVAPPPSTAAFGPDAGEVVGSPGFLRAIVHIAADAIVATDAEQRIVLFNAGAEEIFGYQAAEVIGAPLDVLLPRRAIAAHRAAHVPNFASGPVSSRRMGERREVYGRRRSGEEFPAEVAISRFDVNGELWFAAILRDVSERRRVERAVKESEELFRTAMHSSPVGMALVGLDGRWLGVNRALCGIVGYTEDELRELTFQEITHPDDLAVDLAHVQRLLSGAEQSYTLEKRYVCKDGRVVWVLLSGTLVRTEAGEPRFFIAQVQDVSASRQAADTLARQTDELRRSNEELEAFAYVASHDLQEPLRMVASYTQLLARRYGGQLDADAHRWIGYAVDGAHRMQALINDLLALSRVGTRGGVMVRTDVNAVLARAASTLRGAIDETAARVTSDTLPTVECDTGQLDQLFQNLLANAIKFRRPGVPPEVHVSATSVAADGPHVWEFRVRDNGIGMDMAHADRVFAMFQRLHTREEYPGTGIGLAICRKVVERHGGRIWVESAPGEGATFCFTLPERAA